MGKYSEALLDPPKTEKRRGKYAANILGGTQEQQTPQEAGGLLDPNIVERATFLPFGRTATGETEVALPEIGVDVLKAIDLPGRALRGEQISPEDVTRAALTVGVPALRGISGTATKKIAAKGITRKQVKEAPWTAELKQQARPYFTKASESTAIIDQDSFVKSIANLENKLFQSGYDPDVYKESASVLGSLAKKVGTDLDMVDLQNMRVLAKDAAGSSVDKEARIGRIILDHIDDYVDNLGADDLAAGQVEGAANNLKISRALWAKMAKSRDIDDIFTAAKNQASGFENGLRIGFRAFLKRKNTKRRFSKDEIKAMREIVAGTFTRNTLKRLGKLSGGIGQQTNILGFGLGTGAGAAAGSVFGPIGAAVGAVTVPMAAFGAQKLGERGTRLAAQKARAMAAGARPLSKMVPYSTQRLPRTALGTGLAGADEQRNRVVRKAVTDAAKRDELARFLQGERGI